MALTRGSQSTGDNVADQASRRTASSLTIAPQGAKRPGTARLGSAAFDRVGQGMQCRTQPRRLLALAQALARLALERREAWRPPGLPSDRGCRTISAASLVRLSSQGRCHRAEWAKTVGA